MITKNYKTNQNSLNSNNNNELSSNSNCQNFSSNTNASKGKKPISLKHSSFNNNPMRFSTDQKSKKNLKNLATNINSKLSPENYVKPLYYLLNNQVQAVNKQFLGFKDGRRYLYKNQYPYKNNGNTMFNTALNHKEENKDNTNSKHMSNANKKNKGNKANINNKSSKNNKIGKNDNNNKNNKIKNNKNNNNIKDSKKLNELRNQKATLIQAAVRGLLARNKLYNSLSQYQKFKRDIKTLEKIKQYKAMFFNNLKELKEVFIKNKNNINNISKNNKSKDNSDSNSLNDENNNDINSKNKLRA